MLNKKGRITIPGEMFIVLCAMLWGLISLFSLPLNGLGYSSAEITFMRSVFASFALGLFILCKDKRLFKVSLKDLPLLIFLGVGCFMVVCLLYTASIEENGSSVAAMLMYTSPVWTVIISRFVFKEKITWVKTIALVGVLGGCALLSFGGKINVSLKGILIGLGTGVFLALYGVFGKISGKKYSSETITFYMFAFSTVSSFFVATAWNMPAKIATEPISLVYFVGIALLSTMLAYAFYAAGLKTVSAGKASMISTLEIAVATAVGIIRFGVIPGVWGFVGIALTVLSLVFMQIKDVKTAVVAKSETKSAVLFKAEETVFSEGTAGGLGGESVRVSAAHDKKE